MSEPKSTSSKRAPLPSGFLKDPGHFLAFGLGSGCARVAPGTWGTLAALPLYAVLSGLSWTAYFVAVVLAFFVGVWLCDRAARALGVHDHGGIVWDEFVGLWIALAMRPDTWWGVALVFGLFRFFDIVKPWPIRWLDHRVPGGLGIMIDDVVAGFYALGVWVLIDALIKGA